MIGNGHAGFGRAASEKDPQGHLAGVVPRHAAIPARSRGNGPGSGFAKRCAHGERATALRRRPTTGRARTHAGAAAKRSHDYKPKHGPRRPPSPICTGPGRRPAPTPSTAPEHPRVTLPSNTRTRACAWPLSRAPTLTAHTRPFSAHPGRRRPVSCSATRAPGDVRLQVAADRAAGKHLHDSRNRGKAGPQTGRSRRRGGRRADRLRKWRRAGRSRFRPRHLSRIQSGAPDGPAAPCPRTRAKQGVRVDRADDVRADGVPRPAGGEFRDFGSPRRDSLSSPRGCLVGSLPAWLQLFDSGQAAATSGLG